MNAGMRATIVFAALALSTPALAVDCYVAGGKMPGHQEIAAMRSGPPPVLLIDDETLNDWDDVQLEFALDETGRVTCVQFEYGQERLQPQALALARQWRFKPYLVNGKPVAAWFGQRVDVRWRNPRPTQRVPFPDVRDWATLRIRLEMSPGYMGCIGTDIEIAGDGVLIFESEYRRGARSLTEWDHVRETDRLPTEAVRALVERFRQADFFWLHDSYTGDMQHVPHGWISIAFDGHKKRIHDQDGRTAGMPAEVSALQEEIERLADRERRVAKVGCGGS
jgi:hypothetical protein